MQELNPITGLIDNINIPETEKLRLSGSSPINSSIPISNPKPFLEYNQPNGGVMKNFGTIDALTYSYGEQQPWYDKFGNAVLKFIPDTFLKTAQAVGHVGGFFGYLGDGLKGKGWDAEQFSQTYDNWLVNAASDAQEKLKEELPIYISRQYGEGNFWNKLGTAEFWAQDGFDALSFLASMYVPTAAVMKGAEGLSALAKANGMLRTANLIRGSAWGGSYINSIIGEAGFESKQTYDDVLAAVYDRHLATNLNLGYDEQTAQQLAMESSKKVAAESAANTFIGNVQILALSNAWEMKALFGGAKSVEKEIKDLARKKYLGLLPDDLIAKMSKPDFLKRIGEGIVTEGLWEEGMQSAVQSYEKKKAQGLANNDAAILTNYLGEYFKGYADTDQQLSMFLGGLMGGLMGGYNAHRESKQGREKLETAGRIAEDYKNIIHAADRSLMDYISEKFDKNLTTTNEDGTVRPSLNKERLAEIATQLGYDYSYIKERVEALMKQDESHVDFLDKHYIGRKLFSYLSNPLYENTDEAYQHFLDNANAQANEYQSLYGEEFNNVTQDLLKESLAYTKELRDNFEKLTTGNKDLTINGFEESDELDNKRLALKVLFHEAIKQSVFQNRIKTLESQLPEDPGVDYDNIEGETAEDRKKRKSEYKDRKEKYTQALKKIEDIKGIISDSQVLTEKIKDKKQRQEIFADYLKEKGDIQNKAKRYNELKGKKDKTVEEEKELFKIILEYDRQLKINGLNYFDKLKDSNISLLDEDTKSGTILDSTSAETNLGIKNRYYTSLISNRTSKEQGLQALQQVIDGVIAEIENIDYNSDTVLLQIQIQTILSELRKEFFKVESLDRFFTQEDVENFKNQLLKLSEFVDEQFQNILPIDMDGFPVTNPRQFISDLERVPDDDQSIIAFLDKNGYFYNALLEVPIDEINFVGIKKFTLFLDNLQNIVNGELDSLETISKKANSNTFINDYLKTDKEKDNFFEKTYLENYQTNRYLSLKNDLDNYRLRGDDNSALLDLLSRHEEYLKKAPFELSTLVEYYKEKEGYDKIVNDLQKLHDYFVEEILPLIEKTKGVRKLIQKKSEVNLRINLWNTIGLNLNFDGDKFIISHKDMDLQKNLGLSAESETLVVKLIAEAQENFDNVKIVGNEEQGLNFNIGYLFKILDLLNEVEKKDNVLKYLNSRKDAAFNNFKSVQLQDVVKDSSGNISVVPSQSNLNNSSVVAKYYDNPSLNFNQLLLELSGAADKTVAFSSDWFTSPLNDFFTHGSIERLEEDLNTLQAKGKVEAGGKMHIDTLRGLIARHKEYIRFFNLIDFIKNNKYNIVTLSKKLIEVSAEEEIVPNFQQIVALKEILDFIQNPTEIYSYLSGIAGTGKSKIIGKYLMGVLDINPDSVVALSYSELTSKNISDSITPNKQIKTITELTRDDLKDKLLLVVDEFDALKTNINTPELAHMNKLVREENEARSLENKPLLKVLLLGDYTQIKREDVSNVSNLNELTLRSITLQGEKISINKVIRRITPLSIPYRSDVAEINSVSNLFKYKVDTIQNVESKVSGSILDPEATGVQFVQRTNNDIPDEIVKRLNAVKDSSRKRTVIVSNQLEIEKYQKLKDNLKIDFDIVTYQEAHGQTFDEIYVDLQEGLILKSQARPLTFDFNTAMYTSISRAQTYALVVTNEKTLTTKVDPNILEISEENKLEKEQLKEVITQYLNDIINAYEGNELVKQSTEEIEQKTIAEDVEKTDDDIEDIEDKIEVTIDNREYEQGVPEEMVEDVDDDIVPEPVDITPVVEPTKDDSVEIVEEIEEVQTEPLSNEDVVLNLNSPEYNVLTKQPTTNTTLLKRGQEVAFIPGMSDKVTDSSQVIGVYAKGEDGKWNRISIMGKDTMAKSTSEISRIVLKDSKRTDFIYSNRKLGKTLDDSVVKKLARKTLSGFKVYDFGKQKYLYSKVPLNLSPNEIVEHIKKALKPIVTSKNGEQYSDVRVDKVFVLTRDRLKDNEILQSFTNPERHKGGVFIEVSLIPSSGGIGKIQKRFIPVNTRAVTEADPYMNKLVSFYDNIKEVVAIVKKYNPSLELNINKEINTIVNLFKNDFDIKQKPTSLKKEKELVLKSKLVPLETMVKNISEILETAVTEEDVKLIREKAHELIPLIYRGEKVNRNYSVTGYISFLNKEIEAGNIDKKEAQKFFDKIKKIEDDAINEVFNPESFSGAKTLSPKKIVNKLFKILMTKQRLDDNGIVRELRDIGVDPADLGVSLFGGKINQPDQAFKHNTGIVNNFREIISKNSFIKTKDGNYYAFDTLYGKIIKTNKVHPKAYVSESAYKKLQEESKESIKYNIVESDRFVAKNSPLYNSVIVYAMANNMLGDLNLSDVRTSKGTYTRSTGQARNIYFAPLLFETKLESGDSKTDRYYGALRNSFNTWIRNRIAELRAQGLPEEQIYKHPYVNFNDRLRVKDGKILQVRYWEATETQRGISDENKQYINLLNSTNFGTDLSNQEIREVLENFMVEENIPLYYHSTTMGLQQASSLEDLVENTGNKAQHVTLDMLAPLLDKSNRTSDGRFKSTKRMDSDGNIHQIEGGPFLSIDKYHLESLSDDYFNNDQKDKEITGQSLFGMLDIRLQDSIPSFIQIAKTGQETSIKEKEENTIVEEPKVFNDNGNEEFTSDVESVLSEDYTNPQSIEQETPQKQITEEEVKDDTEAPVSQIKRKKKVRKISNDKTITEEISKPKKCK